MSKKRKPGKGEERREQGNNGRKEREKKRGSHRRKRKKRKGSVLQLSREHWHGIRQDSV